MNSLQAVFNGKCPQCRVGDIFKYPFTKVSEFNLMNGQCACCHLVFSVEPGFFIGAMFVSYAIVVALVSLIGIILFYFSDPALWVYSVVVGCVVLILFPFIFRFSRISYLHLFGGVTFNPSLKPKNC